VPALGGSAHDWYRVCPRLLVWDGRHLRSSQVELEGDKAPRTSIFQYRDVPAGEYEVRGVLIGRDGHERAIAQRSVMVLP